MTPAIGRSFFYVLINNVIHIQVFVGMNGVITIL